MMQTDIRGDAEFARPFDPILSIEFHPDNILTSASFTCQPPQTFLQELVDRLIETIIQEGKP